MILQPGVLTMAWGSVVRQLAAGLDVELDSVEEWYERLPAPETFEVDAGTIEEGTAAALHFEVRGIRERAGGHRARARHPAPRRPGSRMAAAGRPRLLPGAGQRRAQLHPRPPAAGSDGDHNTAGLKATAMRLVNAIPAVVEARPGLLTALDLPPITGRGLVSLTSVTRCRCAVPTTDGDRRAEQ